MNDKIKNKMKKQRKSITVKITSILLSVWLIVSAVFCVAVINSELDKLVNEQQDKFTTLIRNIDNNGSDMADTYVDFLKMTPYYIIDGENPEINCGADGYLDSSMQAVVLTQNEDGTYSEWFDTDKVVKINGYGTSAIDNKDSKSLIIGNLVYDRFKQSITEEQLESISKYLYTKKDKDGNYYELMCKDFYFDEEDGSTIIPKTVEIVLTDEDNTWYAQDEVVETYELSPLFTDDLPLYTSTLDDRNIIPGQFVLGTFKSDNLIDTYTKEDGYTYFDEGYTKVAPFSYVYKNSATVHTTSIAYDENNEVLYGDSQTGTFKYTVTQSNEPNIIINYAKSFNVLHSCKKTLIFGTLVFLLFFMIIGFIITIMMCKVMKTQLVQEQKRNDITNALAHDIKTPLFIISGYAQNLKENVNIDKREHYCDRIIERTDDVNALVHKMLEFSKLESLDKALDLKDVDICEIIEKVTDSFGTLKDGKRFLVKCDAPCIISADYELMHRVISNLVDNAVRYSDNDSNINIAINSNEFILSNKCSNITQEDIKHLTEPYYKVKENREGKGNGLGLSIVKTILDLHNYKLDITLKDEIISFKITLNN